MNRLLVCLSLAILASAVSADETCTPWNDKLDSQLLNQFRAQVKSSSSSILNFGSYYIDVVAGSASWQSATAGDFSTIKQSPSGSTQLCVNGNVNTLKTELTFETLKATLKGLAITSPFGNSGVDSIQLQLRDEVLRLELTATKDSTSATSCTLAVSKVEFTEWGTLRVDFGSGLLNWIMNTIFNFILSKPVVSAMTNLGFGNKINLYVQSSVAPLVAKFSDQYCQALIQ